LAICGWALLNFLDAEARPYALLAAHSHAKGNGAAFAPEDFFIDSISATGAQVTASLLIYSMKFFKRAFAYRIRSFWIVFPN